MDEAGQTYEDEQAALKQKYEGGGGDDLHITAPEPFPEVNPEVFRDVEPLLFRGFITQAAEINGVSFVFKSINHREYELIGLSTGGDFSKPSRVQSYYNLFLAYGVLMVDGQNVLGHRDQHISDLSQFFSDLPLGAQKKVIRYLSEINRRASRAVTLTEAFTIEAQSRLRWAQLRDMDMTSVAATGFPGSETLGLNWGQLTWRALNFYEDQRIQSEADWENAKFVASSMAGKGMSKVHSADRDRREKERKERIERRDKILRFAVLGEPMDKVVSAGGPPVKVASTVAELADQLEKDLKGEKDWHDQVVEEQERRTREAYEQKSRRLQDLMEQHEQESGGKRVSGGSELAGLTPQQVQERLLRRRQLLAQKAASQIVYPELYDERYSEFMDKWNLPAAVAPKPTDRDPSSATPLVARPKGTPWRGR